MANKGGRVHINDYGMVLPCNVDVSNPRSTGCRYPSSSHFDNKKDAVKYWEKSQEKLYSVFSVIQSPKDIYQHKVLTMLSLDDNITAEELRTIARTKDASTLIAVVKNKQCPADLLMTLSRHPHESVRVAVAENLNTPANTLEYLSRSDSLNIKRAVVKNKNCHTKLLHDVLRNVPWHDWETKHVMLDNPNVDTPLLKLLFDSKDLYSLNKISNSDKLDEELLLKLSRVKNDTVLGNVAKNPKSNASALENVVNMTDNPKILRMVAEHPNSTMKTLLEIGIINAPRDDDEESFE